ncbi:hypothetical protein LMG33818_001060 [Halomonadaceae bacterium LMG 33818]|uniref:type 1 glutamine amidotransferase n=1 Tax=Cernens ardua TaxID=3402176 RepID=UPI003EDC5CF2
MKIGLLQCDDLAPALRSRYGNYPELYSDLLKCAEDDIEVATWRIHEGEIPASTLSADAWLISGSKASVYDNSDWISAVSEFVRQLWNERRPVIGICFGHQLLAQVLGGTVEKCHRGWGLGVATNSVVQPQSWMEPQQGFLRLVVSHQDQVLTLPATGEVLAASEFCPYFMVQYGDSFLGVQGHPEFSTLLGRDLLEAHKESSCPERGPLWEESLNGKIDNPTFARWMMDFYHNALKHEAAGAS